MGFITKKSVESRLHDVYWPNKTGLPLAKLSEIVGMNRNTVYSDVKKIRNSVTPLFRKVVGTSTTINKRAENCLQHAICEGPFINYKLLKSLLLSAGIKVRLDVAIASVKRLGFRYFFYSS